MGFSQSKLLQEYKIRTLELYEENAHLQRKSNRQELQIEILQKEIAELIKSFSRINGNNSASSHHDTSTGNGTA